MGTRGAYGFRVGGIDKVTYNHYDSYPSGLGRQIVEFINRSSIGELEEAGANIVLVNESATPTMEQIMECGKYFDSGVSTGNIEDWYCLLRKMQGDLTPYKEGFKYMIDSSGFLSNSLFCEWAYIINLDSQKLEVYKGFNKDIHAKGRYASVDLNGKEYAGVRLIDTVSFDILDRMSNIEMDILIDRRGNLEL